MFRLLKSHQPLEIIHIDIKLKYENVKHNVHTLDQLHTFLFFI